MYKADEINGERFLLDLCCKAEKLCELKADNLQQLGEWKKLTRTEILKALGCGSLKPCNEKPMLTESLSFGSYRRDKYILPTAENLKMPLYVLVPNQCNGKVIIAIHGHGCYGKEGVVGNMPMEIAQVPSNDVKFALELAERGYIAVCPDLLGSGERITGLCENKSKSVCDLLNNTLTALGLSLQGVSLFELIKLTEFALTVKENKFGRAGCLGFSGGGFFSLLLAGMCDNIDMAVVSGYFHTQSDTCLQSNKCGCNFAANMWNIADCGELAALAAPKPLYIECGNEDKLHGRSGVDSVYKQLKTAEKAYSLYNKKDNLSLVLCDGGHRWYSSCYEFLNQALNRAFE